MLFARYYLWIVPHILLAGVLVGLFRRALQRQAPIFVSYVAFELIQFIVLFAIFLHSPFQQDLYQWVLVFSNGIGSVLGLGVVYELANKLLVSRSSVAPILQSILRATLAILLLGAAISSGVLSEISPQRVTNIFEVVDFSSSLILAGMLLALFVFARALQVSWRNWITGVALGFGISACIDLASAALRAGFGHSSFIAVDLTQMAAFHISVVIWLVFLFRSERTPVFPDEKLKLSDMESWNEELTRMVR